jgi:small GTP-binding protein
MPDSIHMEQQEQKEAINSASAALEKVISSVDSLPVDEQAIFEDDIKELKTMLQKLENCHIEIAVFGEVSSGKSALLNALLGRHEFPTGAEHGKTRDVQREDWDTLVHESSVVGNSTIRLVDTPGLNEVDGAQRAEMAKQISRRSDIILFVVDSDLNQVEHAALVELGEANKPIVLVLNKIDILTEQQISEIRESILRDKLPPQVTEHDLIHAAADPKEKEVIVIENGEERLEVRHPAPDVEDLKLRILEYLNKGGKGLVALNAALFASDLSEKIVKSKILLRREEANKTILKYSLIKATAVALNPIPAVDMIGAALTDVYMITHVGKIYGFEVSKSTAIGLWKEVLISSATLFGGEWLAHVISTTIKTSSAGTSPILTATPQAMAAALGSFYLGHSIRIYFANNESWGPGGAKAVVQSLLEQANTDLVKEKLRKIIEKKIGERKESGFFGVGLKSIFPWKG